MYKRAAFQNPPSQHIPDDHLGGLCACSLTSPPSQISHGAVPAVRLPCPPSGRLLLFSGPSEAATFPPPSAPPLTQLPLDSDPAESCSWGPPSQEQRHPRVGGGWTFSWPPPTRDSGDLTLYRGLWLTTLPVPFFARPGSMLPSCPLLPPPGAVLQGFFSVPRLTASPCSQVLLQPLHGDLLGG